MSIAIDQTRLRRISSGLLAGEGLGRAQALAMLNIARIASGADPDHDPQEHTILQAVVQHVCALAGLEPDEAWAIPRIGPLTSRRTALAALGRDLATRRVRELAYVLALLVALSDLDLAATESDALQELQYALDVDDRRATDLTVFVVGHVDSEVHAAP